MIDPNATDQSYRRLFAGFDEPVEYGKGASGTRVGQL